MKTLEERMIDSEIPIFRFYAGGHWRTYIAYSVPNGHYWEFGNFAMIF